MLHSEAALLIHNTTMKKTFQCAAALASAAFAITAAQANPLGIDVSSYQGTINWTSVYASGVKFAFAKATEGNYFQDPDYNNNMKNGKAAGLQMGAYDYSRPDIDTPSTEANYFWNFAGSKIIADGKSIFPAVTFEVFNGHVGTSSYAQWFNDWSNDVKAKTSVFLHPVIYLPNCTAVCDIGSISLGIWVSNINGDGVNGSPWDKWPCTCQPASWDYWQFSTGAISGVSGAVDMDAYDGTLGELRSWQGVGGS